LLWRKAEGMAGFVAEVRLPASLLKNSSGLRRNDDVEE